MSSSKIITFSTACKLSKQFRSENKKVIFCHGVFDILHPGHVQYLKKSKQKGDFLFVATDSDVDVAKLKGSHRPVIEIQHRISLLSNLEFVDYVFPLQTNEGFDDRNDFFEDIYKKLMPWGISANPFVDKYWSKKKVSAGKYGFKYFSIDSENNISTSAIINKLNESSTST